jgi:hypothetical protein
MSLHGFISVNERRLCMDKTLEGRIRERAYEIWNTVGRPHGQAEQHWLRAEREVLAMVITQPPPPQPSAGRRPRSRATPTAAKPQARAVAH